MADIPSLLQRGYRYAVALTADPVAADDLLQDAWLAVLRANGPREAPYLFRAIRSRWIDRYRKESRTPITLEEAPVVAIRAPQDRLVESDALWHGLAALSDEQREVVYLMVVEGWSAAEVAERTGRPRNTVLSTLRRGKQNLQTWFVRRGLGAN